MFFRIFVRCYSKFVSFYIIFFCIHVKVNTMRNTESYNKLLWWRSYITNKTLNIDICFFLKLKYMYRELNCLASIVYYFVFAMEEISMNLTFGETNYFRQIRYSFKQKIFHQARRQKFSEGGLFDTAGGLGVAQGSQKPLGIWCKILKSSNFQTLHSNFRKALFSITNF